MTASPLALGSVLGCQPFDITEIADLRVFPEDFAHQHQHPLIDRIDEDYALTLAALLNGLPHPRGWAFLLALVDDRTERRVDVVGGSPLARQPIEARRQRTGCGVPRAIEP